MQGLKLSEYFKITKPTYKFIKLTPNNSIRNYNSEKIAKAIHSIYKTVYQRIRKYERQFFFETPSKVSYYIYIQKKAVEFYFIIPDLYLNLIKDKINDTWKGITTTEVSELPNFSNEALYYKLNYKKEDALSLAIDRRTNTLLGSSLNVIDVMEDDDSVGIFYNFIPTNQFTWRSEHSNTIEKIKTNQPIDREKLSFVYIFKMTLCFALDLANSIFEVIGDFSGNKKKKESDSYLQVAMNSITKKDLSLATKNKADKTILETQMIVISDSKDHRRKTNNAISVCESFKSLTEDNELAYKKHRLPKKKSLNLLEYRLQGVDSNKTSVDECHNFLALPGRELLEEHKVIEKIDTLEAEVPEELREGNILIGTNIYKGKPTNAYMSTDKNLANLGLVLLGCQGAGKTEYIANYVHNSTSAGEGAIVIDFIKNCELSETIKRVVPKDRIVEVDLSKPECFQGFGYNEIKFKPNMDEFEIIEVSNLQTQQTINLINAINNEGYELTGKMRRYLSAACNVVYINEGTSLRDVVDCLQNHNKRRNFVDRIPLNLRKFLIDEIDALNELDDKKEIKDKEAKEVFIEVVGTKDSKIEFILDRINLLKEDAKLKYMFNKPLNENIDFVDAMEQGKIVLIKMPDSKFGTRYVKNTLVTFFTTKIWLAGQIRGAMHNKPLRNHVIIDEIFQSPTAEKVWDYILAQLRKYQIKPVFSAHYLSQISTIQESLKASGSSFMLFSGVDRKNFDEFKQELNPFTVEDLLNLKAFHTLNLIKAKKEGYAKFISKLPPPIK